MSARLCRRALIAAALIAAALFVLARPASAAGGGYFVDAINGIRAARGMAPLAPDAQLDAVAQAWSQQMAASGTLQHNPAVGAQVTGWRTLGENVGTGPSLESIEGAFERSPHHFENMVDPKFTHIGVGVVRDGNGTFWVTEVFKQSTSAPKPPAPAPKPAAPAPPKPAPKPVAKPAPKPVPKPAATPAAAVVRPAAPAPKPNVAPATTIPAVPPPTVPLAVLGAATQGPETPTAFPASNPFTAANVAGLVATVMLGTAMALFARVWLRKPAPGGATA